MSGPKCGEWPVGSNLERERRSCISIGLQSGTHTNWQLVQNDASGAPMLIDMGASFPVASTTNVLTLTLLAAPNSSEIGVRVVGEVSGAVVETMLDSDVPAATQLLSPRNIMNNGATAAAVAYDCFGDVFGDGLLDAFHPC